MKIRQIVLTNQQVMEKQRIITKQKEDEKKIEQVEPLTVEYVAKKADKAIKDGDEILKVK